MRLSPYALTFCQRFIPSGFDDPKVHSVFKKFPGRPGNLKHNINRQPLNDQQLDEYLEFIEEDLRKKMSDAFKNTSLPYTAEKINNLLNLAKQSDILPTASEKENELFQLGSLLVEKAREMTIAISEDAEKEFRNHPLSENFWKWMATLKMIDAIAADMPSGFAPAHIFLYNKPYTVVTGDTLSKIAQKFYGYENLWDIIWMDSGADFHPDRIVPGQKLSLP